MKNNEFSVNWYAYKVLKKAKFNEKIFVKDVQKLCKNDSLFARAVVDALITEEHIQLNRYTDSLDLPGMELKKFRCKYKKKACRSLLKWHYLWRIISVAAVIATLILSIIGIMNSF